MKDKKTAWMRAHAAQAAERIAALGSSQGWDFSRWGNKKDDFASTQEKILETIKELIGHLTPRDLKEKDYTVATGCVEIGWEPAAKDYIRVYIGFRHDVETYIEEKRHGRHTK